MKTSTLLMLSLLLCLSFVEALAAESEPNDSKAQANILPLGGSQTGTAALTNEDWFSVTTTADGQVNMTITSNNGQNVYCNFYDNNGTTFLGGTYTNSTRNYSVDGLTAGTFYVRVYAYYSNGTPTYTVSNTFTDAVVSNDTEPNGTVAQAKNLPVNNSRTGHIGYLFNSQRDSLDWWKVTIPADGRIRLRITSGNGQYVVCELFDNNGTTALNTGEYSNGTKDINTDGLAAGTYYVRIRAYYSNGFIPYTLADSLFSPAQANDTEPNGTAAQALTLGLNSSATGHINYYYNNLRDSADWYKVTTNADGRLRLTITSNNGQYVHCDLFDNNTTISLNSDYTNGTKEINTDGLAAGTYYVRIRPYYSNGFIPYILADSLFTPAQANDNEPNDTYTQAVNLPANGSRTGHAGYYNNNKRDSADWYRIVLPEDGNLNITFTSNNGQYIYARLFDNNGSTAISGTPYTNGTTSFNNDGLAAGTYYLRIYPYYSNGYIPYTITSIFTTYANTNDTEPNDAPYQAKTVPANGTATGHIGFYQNGGSRNTTDWWKINYTGSGALTLNASLNNWISNGSSQYFYIQVYKDTSAGPVYSDYFLGGSGNINLTSLTQGYYYVKLFMYYSDRFAAYSLTNTFTQVNIASVNLRPTSAANCDSTGSLRIQCSGSSAPYRVQLFRFGIAYGSSFTVNNTNPVTINNLPTGLWGARVFGDGATGTAFGQTSGSSLMPVPTGLSTTNIAATQARLIFSNFTPCVDGYSVQYRKTGDTLWTLDTAGKSPFILKKLAPGTTYTWRVASGDTTNGLTAISRYSDSLTFTTLSSTFASVSSSETNSANAVILNNASITAWPNPAQSQVKLQVGNKINETVSATLRDMNGRILWNKQHIHASALNNQVINVANIPNGIYILQVIGADNKPLSMQKIVVSH